MNIKRSTFDFLEQLTKNNNREWFQENKALYDDAHQNVKDFITAMIVELSKFDPQITTDIVASKCLFRIYRDVRFSKNKDPYKTWFSAGISLDGRKLAGPEYYFHIEPEKSFIACGYWRPEKLHLELIRQEIDYNSAAMKTALKKGGWQVEDLSSEDKLVRPPAGYDAENENIEQLKLKSFILYKKLEQKDLTSDKAMQNVIDACESMYPFKLFIHQALDQ
ncbi:DUF2461 domain-containing protein [Sphingobacterium hungaricum]|uniref:TIGR02453 family protein n=1 Tax=Sphingobacterium hungaricum TaxID=2082723 RepID=A0A928UUD8_9SPHI|nr:DUF2461 domain-containing protein [Sphingobacterium hungaricum]MBE8712912.1 TIGR02453 family protein [Sphingobacterium hungaricum]